MLDHSVESFRQLEQAFWRMKARGIPSDFTDEGHVLLLMGQYLGEAIVRQTGAKWVQSTAQNPTFAQPCLDGFGNEPWDRIYPVLLAQTYAELQATKPQIPGVSDNTVFARLLEKALELHRARSADGSP